MAEGVHSVFFSWCSLDHDDNGGDDSGHDGGDDGGGGNYDRGEDDGNVSKDCFG